MSYRTSFFFHLFDNFTITLAVKWIRTSLTNGQCTSSDLYSMYLIRVMNFIRNIRIMYFISKRYVLLQDYVLHQQKVYTFQDYVLHQQKVCTSSGYVLHQQKVYFFRIEYFISNRYILFQNCVLHQQKICASSELCTYHKNLCILT